MPEPLDLGASVELAIVERNGFPESRHLGAAVLVDADGSVLDSLGDPARLIYPRSAAKPLQAAAMLRLGAPLSGVHLAIAQASHAGQPEHTEVVAEILADAGLGPDDLQCPEAWPRRPDVIRGMERAERITMTCSGKHAGFLCGAMHIGADPGTYLDRGNPVQQAVSSTIEELSGEHVAHWGVDGCRAPTPVLSMVGFARAVSRVLREHPALLEAARTAPWAIDEQKGENAVVIRETGAFAKTGAEGVMVISLGSGQTVVTKTLDGGERVGTPVALEVLARAGLLERETVQRILSEAGDSAVRVAF